MSDAVAWVRDARRRRATLKARYDHGRVDAPLVERLSDEDLQRLNDLLPWQSFVADGKGRPFGRPAWAGKRVDPQAVPDPRIERFDDRFDLSDAHVLEVGCFEGVHTVALCRRARAVTAIDGRVENVVKTLVRCAFFDERPRVLTVDVDAADFAEHLPDVDLCHHVGVLYHLVDPVGHLQRLATRVGRGLMLDTHVAAPDSLDGQYDAGGRSYRYRTYAEGGRGDAFSGLHEHAKWLTLDDLTAVLRECGFATVDVAEQRDERNGPRVLLFAERGGAA
jgi:tRNA (mo5U34)-methyltransferase